VVNRHNRLLVAFHVLSDSVLGMVAFILSYLLRFETAVLPVSKGTPPLGQYVVNILPFIALLVPLFKIGPPLYQWRIRSRIYRWYAAVRAIDARLLADSISDRDSLLNQLQELERDVGSIEVPLAYTGELYHLRLHIHLLRQELRRPHAQDSGSVPVVRSRHDGDR